jgi:hypothetical protein
MRLGARKARHLDVS